MMCLSIRNRIENITHHGVKLLGAARHFVEEIKKYDSVVVLSDQAIVRSRMIELGLIGTLVTAICGRTARLGDEYR